MQPNAAHILIDNNRERIVQFLNEVILAPRKRMVEWSIITNQTPSLKIRVPGQTPSITADGNEGHGDRREGGRHSGRYGGKIVQPR
jgi:hypothetical protein